MKVLVTGASGQLGADLVMALRGELPPGGVRRSLMGPDGPSFSDLDVVGANHSQLPVESRSHVGQLFDEFEPELVFHCGAYTAVDACESDEARAYGINAIGTRNIAEASRRVGAHLVYISTDYVFDGTKGSAYREWDDPNPMSVYGRSKLAGERECPPDATIVRTSWVAGAQGANMVKTALRLAAGEGPLRFVSDQHGSPTFCADLAAALVTLGTNKMPGIFHVTNAGATTWFGFVQKVLSLAGADPSRVHPIHTDELDPPRPAPRPANSILENAALSLLGLGLLPEWEDGLTRLVRALGAAK